MLIAALSIGALAAPLSATVAAYIDRPEPEALGDYMLESTLVFFLIISLTTLVLGGITQ